MQGSKSMYMHELPEHEMWGKMEDGEVCRPSEGQPLH